MKRNSRLSRDPCLAALRSSRPTLPTRQSWLCLLKVAGEAATLLSSPSMASKVTGYMYAEPRPIAAWHYSTATYILVLPIYYSTFVQLAVMITCIIVQYYVVYFVVHNSVYRDGVRYSGAPCTVPRPVSCGVHYKQLPVDTVGGVV